MTKMGGMLVVVGLLGGVTSCNQPFYGSAEAPEGGRYVVGQDGSDAAIWWCPKAGGDCRKVELEVVQ